MINPECLEQEVQQVQLKLKSHRLMYEYLKHKHDEAQLEIGQTSEPSEEHKVKNS
jgi:hypothetical protein